MENQNNQVEQNEQVIDVQPINEQPEAPRLSKKEYKQLMRDQKIKDRLNNPEQMTLKRPAKIVAMSVLISVIIFSAMQLFASPFGIQRGYGMMGNGPQAFFNTQPGFNGGQEYRIQFDGQPGFNQGCRPGQNQQPNAKQPNTQQGQGSITIIPGQPIQ